MRARSHLLAVLAVILAACGGSPGDSSGAVATPGGGGATAAPGGNGGSGSQGGSITVASDFDAALPALEALGSWRFEATVIAASSGGDLTITGTERRQPESAVSATHVTLGETFQYVRIGDDIWADVGTGEFYHYDAADARNLISQYEPFHLDFLWATATASAFDEYELVGTERVNGVDTRHYRQTEYERSKVTDRLGLSPDDWLGDVWIASDGDYLVRVSWGPATPDVMAETGGIGFTYDATDFGCTCPVEPPV